MSAKCSSTNIGGSRGHSGEHAAGAAHRILRVGIGGCRPHQHYRVAAQRRCGRNIAGAVLTNLSLGTLWNSVPGIVGGGLGGKILGMLIPSLGAVAASKAGGAGIDIGAIIGTLAGDGVGGGH